MLAAFRVSACSRTLRLPLPPAPSRNRISRTETRTDTMTDDNLIYAPFAGIIPTPFYAGEVAAPPYDVLSSAEAKVRALGNAYSFCIFPKPR